MTDARTHHLGWLTLIVALALALAVASPAQAQGPPQYGEGSGAITAGPLPPDSIRVAGPNVIQERTLTAVFNEGPLVGTMTEHTRGVIHPTSGHVTFQGTMHFVGEVVGCGEGTLTARFNGIAEAGSDPIQSEVNFRVVAQGKNDIPVTAHGTITQTGLTFTYDVHYICRA